MPADILSPLAGDTLSPGTVTVVVAYDFSGGFRHTTYRLTCAFGGFASDPSHVDVTGGDPPGQTSFAFQNVTAGTNYEASVRVDGTLDDGDLEGSITVASNPTLAILSVSLPNLSARSGGGQDAPPPTCTVSGTTHNAPNPFRLRGYKLVPRGNTGFLRRLLKRLGIGGGGSKSRPFVNKFTHFGAVTNVTAAASWEVEVMVPAADHDRIFRATPDGGHTSSPRSTRGVPHS